MSIADTISGPDGDLLDLHRSMTLPNLETAVEHIVATALGLPDAAVANAVSFELDRSQPRTALGSLCPMPTTQPW